MFGWKSGKKNQAVAPQQERFREESIPRSVLARGITQTVTFEYYAPFAASVSVAGSFNRWTGAHHPLRKDSSGKWRLTLDPPLGRHEYKFIVDGEWVNDQRPVDAIPNAFGGYNNVVTLG